MVKRLLTIALGLAVAVAFTVPAMAEVKSIKVGGDAVIRMIMRDNLDFLADSGDESEAWIMSQIRLYVGAELSDNVSAMVRLINERDWGKSYLQTMAGAGGVVGLPADSSDDIKLDLAYLKIGDLFVPGLSATLGRQEILLGKGFVVGNANGTLPAVTANTAIRASDLTARKSFDAWRLDYQVGTVPLTLTLFDAKVIEESANDALAFLGLGMLWSGNDVDLLGLNAAYKLDNATIEGYALNLNANLPGDNVDIWTIGARVDHNLLAVPGLNYNIELAWQTGDLPGGLDQNAFGGMVDISYTAQNQWLPKIGAAWTYYSGDDDATDDENQTWIPLFPDNQADRIGAITYAATLGLGGANLTNISVPKLYAAFSPAERHTISLAWYPQTLMNEVPSGADDELGYEVDLGYSCKITDDVSFGLLAAYADSEAADEEAMQVIGTVAVSF